MPFTATPNDPIFPLAWHLRNTGQAGGTPGVDLRLLDAWGHWSGRNVLVAVMDEGVEATHPDLLAQMWTRPAGASVPADPNLATGLPVATGIGSGYDNHATPVAGIIAASGNNGVGAIGIAPDAKIVSYRVLGADAADPDNAFAQGLLDGAAIFNASYGGSFGLKPEAETLAALEQVAREGRGGLGAIVVKSNGNERLEPGAPSPHDGGAETMNASRFTIAVAAVDNRGVISSYSSPGGNLFISGFGGPGDDLLLTGDSVAAPDRAGTTNGYNGDAARFGGDYTGFNGTSAAAPTVSGVVALMLEANPELGYRDVMEILAYTARLTDTLAGTPGHDSWFRSEWLENSAGNKNGGGLTFSHDYGFGLADAGAAIRLAETWTAQRTEHNLVTSLASPSAGLGSGFASGAPLLVTFNILQPEKALPGFRLNAVELTLDLDAARPSDLTVELISPDGTGIRLLTTTGNTFMPNDYGDPDYVNPYPWPGPSLLGTPGFWGESAVGTWTLVISTKDGGVGGSLKSAGLLLTGDSLWQDAAGTQPSPDLRSQAVYTDDFALAVAAEPGRVVLGTPGQDAINAAPMTGRVVLDLSAGTGSLNGIAVTLAPEHALRHAFGGAAGDDLRGSAAANTLDGGWGDDLLMGFGGADALRGGAGRDTLIGNEGNDQLTGGVGRDFAIFGVNRGDAVIDRLADGTVRVSSAEGMDHLSSVEGLVFLDGLRAMGMARPTDFTGDGYGDLLFRNGDGAMQIWRLHGDGLQGAAGFSPNGASIAATDTLVTTGDWSGDGRADILWRGVDGALRFTVSLADSWTTVDLGVVEGWAVRALADLDGDGRADLVWQHETGFLAGWTATEIGFLTLEGGVPAGLGTGWEWLAAADATGDGRADQIFCAPAGEVFLWACEGLAITDTLFLGTRGADWDLAGSGDLDGNGRADLLWWDPAQQGLRLWLLDETGRQAEATLGGPGDGWSFAALADYSGDDRADILWRSGEGDYRLWEMDGTTRLWSGNLPTQTDAWSLLA
ncbi:S8 family serine peptidase [Sabulicella rubraurantiaca]|uniref:S8 family serine peptidase n=1 Tax=Sabulicella rubraurantiaca TaxID=2811429 RepID=UPI001A95CD5A|nr:S8 family serine peptidase [Sabulicella rubraurantiaca]